MKRERYNRVLGRKEDTVRGSTCQWFHLRITCLDGYPRAFHAHGRPSALESLLPGSQIKLSEVGGYSSAC